MYDCGQALVVEYTEQPAPPAVPADLGFWEGRRQGPAIDSGQQELVLPWRQSACAPLARLTSRESRVCVPAGCEGDPSPRATPSVHVSHRFPP